jgi:hypothetical protein
MMERLRIVIINWQIVFNIQIDILKKNFKNYSTITLFKIKTYGISTKCIRI